MQLLISFFDLAVCATTSWGFIWLMFHWKDVVKWVKSKMFKRNFKPVKAKQIVNKVKIHSN